MAVQPEYFGPAQLTATGTLALVLAGLRRRLDGRYMVNIRLNGELVLPDGRVARVNDLFMDVPVTQVIGRKRQRNPAA